MKCCEVGGMLKHQTAQRTLLEIVSTLKPGEALPSIRTIMEQYKFSQSTVTRRLKPWKRKVQSNGVPGPVFLPPAKYTAKIWQHCL